MRSELERRLEGQRLTPAHRRIVQIIVDHASDIGFLTSMELAELANVSQPSVSRFAVALGFDGFLEMRRELRSYSEPALAAPVEGGNKYQLAAVAEARNVAELVEELGDAERIRAFGKALANSKPLPVLGIRAAAGLATQFGYFASKVHPDIRTIVHGGSFAEDQLEQARDAGANWMLAFAMPLYPRETIHALQYAKQIGLKIAVVSDTAFRAQGEIADQLLTARIHSRLVFDSCAAGTVLVSVLLDAMCDAMPERAEARLEAGDRSSLKRKVFIR
ncbi:MurR/RpiR family transcriptional regulator [Trinickia symbiotica]|uniref:MurR/RpiR family transcriptional regulator n=1 Tax=Trinickia symbiotica TaxID=863227 RepID=A0A2N7WP92_9BURK|nr:MurR/RpiR family transcriptional regulator [Trinickia symbiotica]PTB16947.1 MurR/RpiR family transcriptional regulator [Trinickia symbiotica]